jgi:hypothetical protein
MKLQLFLLWFILFWVIIIETQILALLPTTQMPQTQPKRNNYSVVYQTKVEAKNEYGYTYYKNWPETKLECKNSQQPQLFLDTNRLYVDGCATIENVTTLKYIIK